MSRDGNGPRKEGSLSESATRFEVRLFGRPEVRIAGRRMEATRTRKGLWLLALLALRRGEPAERAWLAALLWPDSPDALGLYNLRRSLSDLRERLGPEAGRLHSPTPRSLTLRVDGCFLDVAELERAASAGDAPAAMAVYRGPLLEGCTEEWVFPEREHYEQRFLEVVERHAAEGPAAAERCWRRILAIDPLRESAVCGLLRTLRDTGNIAAATEAYRDFRARLRGELNAEPAASTTRLYEEVRAAAREGRPPRPEPVWLGRPPAAAWPLFGRELEIAAAREALEANRAVVLTGPGGIGKTRLAIAAAEALVRQPGLRAGFVDLSPVFDGALVASAIAEALEIRVETDQPPEEALVRSLSARQVLLVLDNCEQVDGACAEILERLVADCPELGVLATSRHVLRAPSAFHLPVPPLSLTEGSEAPSVRLFVDRARRVLPSFELTDENREAVARICASLEGMPLAIELAAARIRGLTAPQMADRLQSLLPRLEATSFAVPARHLNLAAVMDWSHALLAEPEQVLFRRLSVFSGGCTLESAEAVCGVPPLDVAAVEELLFSLLERSLLVYEEVGGEGRYRLLETVRQYAAGRLTAAGEAAALRDRHLEFFLKLAEQTDDALLGPGELAWLGRLDREHPNLRAALQWAGPAQRLQIAGAFWRYWFHRGLFAEARGWLSGVLEQPDGCAPHAARARTGLAVVTWYTGDHDFGERLMRMALVEYRLLGDPRGEAASLHNLGTLALERGRHEEARELLTAARAIHERVGNRRGLAFTVGNLAALAVETGDPAAAEPLLAENERLLRLLGLHQTLGGTYLNRARVELHHGRMQAARELLEEALCIHERFGHRLNSIRARNYLAVACARMGDLDAARRELEQAVRDTRELGAEPELARAVWGYAHLAAYGGQPARAARLIGAWERLGGAPNQDAVLQRLHRDLTACAREALGKEAFERLRSELAGLTAEETLRIA